MEREVQFLLYNMPEDSGTMDDKNQTHNVDFYHLDAIIGEVEEGRD